jgi:nitroreductase
MADAFPTVKLAANDHPILDVLRKRWSGRALDERPLPHATLSALLEAARWAPSSGNSQPWRFLVFDRSDTAARADAEACLNRGNAWAKRAPVLLVCVAREVTDKGTPNEWGRHDLGLANENLLLQASALGLIAHPMAGFDRTEAKKRFAIPDEFSPLVMIAIGYPGDPDQLEEPNRTREREPRKRKPLGEIAFIGRWDRPYEP